MTTITPTHINEPKQAGWSWSVKATDGNYYGVKAELKDRFRVGVPIDVEITSKEKNGKTYRDIARVLSNGPAPAGDAPAIDPRYQKQPTPLVDAERMFVAGICNALLPKIYEHEQKMDSQKIVAVVMAARTAWAQTFGRRNDD
jgi:hypothetical protein